MNPFGHAARHLVGGLDPLDGVIQQFIHGANTGTTGLVQSGAYPIPDQQLITVGFDFTGRSGDSTVLFFSTTVLDEDSGSVATNINTSIFVDGTELIVAASEENIRAELTFPSISGNDVGTLTQFAYKTDLSAGAHTVEVWAGVSAATTPTAVSRMILGLDLGLT
jgi:hypothetical protein